MISKSPHGRQKSPEKAQAHNSRSPGEIRHHIGVVIHRNSGSAIMTTVRTDRGKAVLRSVSEIFILDTYVDGSILSLGQNIYCILLCSNEERTYSHLCHHYR